MGHPYTPRILDLLVADVRRPPEWIAWRTDRQLCYLVRHVWSHVPLYRHLWSAAGVSPDLFAGRRSLPGLPFVDKVTIVAAGAEARDPQAPLRSLRSMTTSGTSGRSITTYFTLREMRVLRRSILRHLLAVGARPRDRFLTVASAWLREQKGVVMRLLTRLSGTRHLDIRAPLDEQINTLLSLRPKGLIGQTGGIYILARELCRRGQTLPMKTVITTGTTLLGDIRQMMVDAFAVQPRDLYGAVELGPISWQCRRGNYHVDADRVVVEIVDDAGRRLPDGERGHVVVTSLYQYTMPLIRYRLQDIAALSLRSCDCGCRFPLMEPVQGRVNDFLATPTGDLVSPHFFFHLFDQTPTNPVKDWRVVQDDVKHLVYEYVPLKPFCERSLSAGVDLIRRRFGPDCDVQSRMVNDLPLTPAGKRRCIVSKLRPATMGFDRVWIGGDADAQNGDVTRSH